MKRKLARLQSIRSLVEELARADLEIRMAEARRLEAGAAQQRHLVRVVRSQALESLESATEEAPTDWQLAMADVEILTWKRKQLTRLAAASRPAIGEAREQFMARRRESRQVEILAADAAQRAEGETTRREQKLIDDWYQARMAQGRRRR